MKKTYSKPEIAFEDFSLSVGIAAGCEYKISNQSQGTCGYKYSGGGGATMFTAEAGTSVCNIPVTDATTNGFCYHVPASNINIFNS